MLEPFDDNYVYEQQKELKELKEENKQLSLDVNTLEALMRRGNEMETLHDGSVIRVGDRINSKTWGDGIVVSFYQVDPIYSIDVKFDSGKEVSLWRADTSLKKIHKTQAHVLVPIKDLEELSEAHAELEDSELVDLFYEKLTRWLGNAAKA